MLKKEIIFNFIKGDFQFMSTRIRLLILVMALIIFGPFCMASATEEAGIYKVSVGGSKIIKINETIKKIVLGNPNLAEYTVLSKNEILLLGTRAGHTELNIWTESDLKTFMVQIRDDIFELKNNIAEIMGFKVANAINISVVKDTAVIKGFVATPFESEQLEKIVLIYFPKVLNLIEVRKNSSKPEITKKIDASEPVMSRKMEAPAIQSQQQPVMPETTQMPNMEPEKQSKPKDILEIKAYESYKENPDAYDYGIVQGDIPLKNSANTEYYNKANTKNTRIITLQNAVAEEVALALDKVKSPDGSIVKDTRTNSLILMDKPAMIEKMISLIKVLDVVTPQVLIEAKIIEVTLNDDMTNTLNWIYDTLYSGANSLGTSLNNKSIGVNSGDMTMALDYGKISSDHFTMKVLPSLKNRHARLLSSPATVTLDRKEATFGVTDNIPYLKYTPQGTTGTLLPTPEYVTPAPGITLKVTPTINQNDVIRMNINIQIGSFVENVTFGQYGSVPRTSSRQTSNIVEVGNNETLIISGLMRNDVYKTANKVPWFAKIPLVGQMFSNKISGASRTELVIFITPKIVGKDSRYAYVDRSKYPRIAENKYPEVDEKIDFKKGFFGDDEKAEVTKKVNSEFEIPKVERNTLDESKKVVNEAAVSANKIQAAPSMAAAPVNSPAATAKPKKNPKPVWSYRLNLPTAVDNDTANKKEPEFDEKTVIVEPKEEIAPSIPKKAVEIRTVQNDNIKVMEQAKIEQRQEKITVGNSKVEVKPLEFKGNRIRDEKTQQAIERIRRKLTAKNVL